MYLTSSLFFCGLTLAAQANGHRKHGLKPGKESIMSEIAYTQIGDYNLPNIVLSDPQDAKPLGRFGRIHKEFLREHRPILYNQLLLTERLYPLCREIDKAATQRLAAIPNRETAHEVVLSELVYA
jgi:hypothetical protein